MKTEYMHLQYYTNTDVKSIFPGEVLIFNQIISSTDGINYNFQDGTILLEKLGTYQVKWSAMFNISADSGALSLETDQGTRIPGIAIDYESTLSTGSVFIKVTAPMRIKLVNRSANELVFLVNANTVTSSMDIHLIESTDKSSPIVIPFISKEVNYPFPVIDKFGKLQQISIIGTGNSGSTNVIGTDSNQTRFANQFNMSYTQDYLIFPYEVTLVAAVSYISNRRPVEMNTPDTNISPYVAIALPVDESESIYEVVEETKVYAENGFQFKTELYSEGTIFTAAKTGLNIAVPAGTPILRVCGLLSLGSQSVDMMLELTVNGSMVFEIAN